MQLNGKVAIVTGAAGGIGLGIAQVFGERGAKVVCSDIRATEGEAVAHKIRDAGGDAIFVPCDVADQSQVEKLVAESIAHYGRIDGLVNNAGVNFVKPFTQMTVKEWDWVMSIDLRGTFLCIRSCIEPFLKQGAGSVVTIASVHTVAAVPGAGPYDAAKWGVVGMTKSLAVEFASQNIRFNCLSPGLIDTQIWLDLLDAAENVEECVAHWKNNIPAGRVGTPREMGQIAAFLISDDASYVTGANLLADGGMTSQLISKENYKNKPVSD